MLLPVNSQALLFYYYAMIWIHFNSFDWNTKKKKKKPVSAHLLIKIKEDNVS